MRRPRMTRWHYRTIGAALRSVRDRYLGVYDVRSNLVVALDDVLYQIADVFSQDNPRFDREKFLRYVRTGKEREEA